jgi:hypothetical protein
MDVATLKARQLANLRQEFHITKQPHFKGGFTSQQRVSVANNTFMAWNELQGQLAEWDGLELCGQ